METHAGQQELLLIGIFTRAYQIAQRSNQLIGERNEMYVTLEQLHEILMGERRIEPAPGDSGAGEKE